MKQYPQLRPAVLLLFAFISSGIGYSQTINTTAGNGTGGFSGDGGAATAAKLNAPASIVTDRAGNQYISDKSNNRIRKVNTSGIISTIAGIGSAGYSGDGGPATAAELNTNAGIAVDTFGNVYIADQSNSCIRKINTSGTITTIAGTGTSGFSGDGGPATAAKVNLPEDVAVDYAGNIFIADYGNSRVRMINASGIISTFAGTSSFGSSGDGGPATAAQIVPYRLAVDLAGNVYAAEYWSNKIRKIATSGIITSVVGTGTAGFAGDGGPASAALINGPYGIAVDKYGSLFINDQLNRRIRKVNLYGTISTYCGTGTFGYTGDGGPASAARIGDTRNVSVNDTGDIFFADITYHRTRIIRDNNHAPVFTHGASQSFSICENRPARPIDSILTMTDADTNQIIMWEVLVAPPHGSLGGFTYSDSSTGAAIVPVGLTYTPAFGFSGNDTFKIKVLDGTLSDTIAIYVTVNPSPNAGTISGPSGVCLTHTALLTETASGGTWLATNSNASITSVGIVTGVSPGPDTIRYIVSTGCGIDSTAHFMNVDIILDLPIITGPDSVCVGAAATLSNSFPGGTWLSSDTSIAKPLGGGVFYGVAPGFCNIMYVESNSCGSDTSFRNHFKVSNTGSCASGVTTLTAITQNTLSIFPNPNSGTFSILIATKNTEPIQIQITDLLGRSVGNYSVAPNQNHELRLNAPNGFYFIHATTGSEILVQKLLIN